MWERNKGIERGGEGESGRVGGQEGGTGGRERERRKREREMSEFNSRVRRTVSNRNSEFFFLMKVAQN